MATGLSQYSKNLLRLLRQKENLGLTVTDTSMLFPRKSVTAIVGCQTVDEEGPKTQRGCTSCSQVECASRKLPEKGTTSCI